MGEGEPVSKRSWFILGGILLSLWLCPLFYSLGLSAYKKHQKADYDRRAEAFRLKLRERFKVVITDEERARWKEQARLEKIAEEAERDRKRNEYLASPIEVPMRPSSFRVDDDEDRPRTKIIYYKPDPAYEQRRSYSESQPDLSGFYWQRNFGTFQYVQGPF